MRPHLPLSVPTQLSNIRRLASQRQPSTPAPLQADAMGTMNQTITINLSLCASCLSQPQQNIVFQLPPSLGHKTVPIVIQLPTHQAASQVPTTTHIVSQPQVFEGHPPTNALTPVPAPQIPAQHNPLPQGQMSASIASLGGECGSGSCNCGPSCRCVGCVVHPYNSATQEFVFSAYQDVVDFSEQQGLLWDPPQSALSLPAVATGGSGVDVGWPVDPHLASDSGSPPPMVDDTRWNDDFLLVDYPNRATDIGITERCTRRPNCCCVDCVIHYVQTNSASDTPG